MVESKPSGYASQKARMANLAALGHRVKDQLQVLEMTSQAETIKVLIERLGTDVFRLLVLGEFKAGKSTVINAMLGQKILPSFSKPCTAIINEIKWGASPEAFVYERVKDGPSQRKPIDITDLNEYVVIKDSSIKGDVSPFEKIEILWPLDICKNGVEVVDSPGLNESDTRQKVTLDYMTMADAILFTLNCDKLGGKSEIDIVETLNALGYAHLFFICNKFDLVDEGERRDFVDYAHKRLAHYSAMGRDGVYLISGRKALDGRLNSNPALVEESGILPMEKRIEKFLVEERGRIKFMQPASQLSESIAEMLRVIPEKERLARTSAEILENNYRQAEKPLSDLEKQREHIRRRIYNFRVDVKDHTRMQARQFYTSLETKVPEWLADYTIENPFRVWSGDLFRANAAVERVGKEISDFLSGKIEREAASWQASVLQPDLGKRVEGLKNELDAVARDFLAKVEAIKFNLGSGAVAAPDVDGAHGPGRIGALERIAAAAGGFLLGDIVSAQVGWTFGFGEMLKNVAVQAAVVLALAFVGIANPWLLLLAALGAGGVRALFTQGNTNEQIKNRIAQEFVKQVQLKSSDLADTVAASVFEKLSPVEEVIDKGMEMQIRGIRDRVEAALRDKRAGNQKVEESIRQLEGSRNELLRVKSEIDGLITEVIAG